jgi:hypothetical protein
MNRSRRIPGRTSLPERLSEHAPLDSVTLASAEGGEVELGVGGGGVRPIDTRSFRSSELSAKPMGTTRIAAVRAIAPSFLVRRRPSLRRRNRS